ncbi:vitamin K epoxide reductase family protein [Rubrobacter marinus]|uniref:vitamin K epoxide reductase family protein n=1 Tax=Rubrobacter marinus TaxID=2653852 RepID=UPI00140A8E1B|nr:vitamin K epoxide reductase family protein [Rubrobacter marinus]
MASLAESATERGKLRTALAGLAVAGISISAYLAWVHFAGIDPLCVAGSDGCDTVQSSQYASVLSVPVSVLGLAGYTGLLFASVLKGEAGAYLVLLLALSGTLFSTYLTYLEIFVIEAICQWCVASAAVITAALVCATLRVVGLPTHR